MANQDTVTRNTKDKSTGFGHQLLNTGLPTEGFLEGVPAEIEARRWNLTYTNNFMKWEDYNDIDWKASNYITQWGIEGITIVANPVITASGHDFQNGQKVFWQRFLIPWDNIFPGNEETLPEWSGKVF